MLWMVSSLLLVLWLFGMLTAAGPWIHVVLVLAALAVVASLMQRNRLDSI